MPNCCVVYTTDNTYLFPTFVSAMQARRNASPDKADVIIFCLGLSNEAERVFAPMCARENIGLTSISREMVEGQTAMLARLFMNRFVPAEYTQYLYLDGDVHILDSLDPLLDASVPEGGFLAANDPITFLLADFGMQSQDLSKHMRSIGLTREQALCYFNSGVLRINRQGWDATGLAAWDYFQRNGGPSRFPDQDALNIVAVHKRLPMSLAWNFPVFMRNSRVEAEIKPRITHFMSSPKPWHGSFPPGPRRRAAPMKTPSPRIRRSRSSAWSCPSANRPSTNCNSVPKSSRKPLPGGSASAADASSPTKRHANSKSSPKPQVPSSSRPE